MSAFIKQETSINDVTVLVEALKAKGYQTVEVNEEAKNLVGYHGDVRAEKAEVIVRRKFVGSASNDIGFKRDANGNFEAIISQYDSGKHNKAWMDSLKQEYGVIKAKKIAKQQGFTLVKETATNGKTRMQFTVRA